MKPNLKVDLLNKIKKLRFQLTKSLNSKIVSNLNKPNSSQPSTPSSFPPPTRPPPPPVAMHRQIIPFLFPQANSTVVPDPSTFFSPHLLSSPLPTNSFFQNFVLRNGDQAEYFHPYLIKSATNSLSVSYPSFFATLAFIYQVFTPDLTISTARNAAQLERRHVVTAAHDLSITLHLPPDLTFFLVRGSPFVTAATARSAELAVTSAESFLAVSSNPTRTKHRISLSNNQTWLCYSSSALELDHNSTRLTSAPFSGVVRFAVLPGDDPAYESLLDRFSSCYPISGTATVRAPYSIEYKWEKKGWGDLLLLAHPLHIQLLSTVDEDIRVLDGFKYTSIDGELVGVVADKWVLKADPISVTWYSINGVDEDAHGEITDTLAKDVANLTANPINTTSSYFYGKAIARAARLALIAEEVCYPAAIPDVRSFLMKSITPWLDGTFEGNGFLYESKWGGMVTKQGAVDSGADFGFGIYNDHHFHLGYFLYASAVLVKLDPAWGRRYRSQIYSMVADFMNLGSRHNSHYTKLRCFDLWKLHSWAGGLTEFADGRNQESTSEAINAYYAAALVGLAYGDAHLAAIGSTLTAMEMRSAQTWWHIREGETMYGAFGKENRVVGVLWSNKRDSGLWFAPADWREIRLGIQVLPLLPITEVLFSDGGFAKELVEWAVPAMEREGVQDGWKGFVYAVEGIYDTSSALKKVKKLNGYDDGNSLSNLLWWLHSREGVRRQHGPRDYHGHSWFAYYCH